MLGGSLAKLYMPLPLAILQFVDNITVGFKNTSASRTRDAEAKMDKIENNEDWLCTEGTYENDTISCKIPNVPHFDNDSPFYMLDVSFNGQDFTDLPHTFRYYFISDTKVVPSSGTDDAEPECRIQGQGLFDTPGKQLRANLDFTFAEKKYRCERNVDSKWNKG